jgi:hypothetical protein
MVQTVTDDRSKFDAAFCRMKATCEAQSKGNLADRSGKVQLKIPGRNLETAKHDKSRKGCTNDGPHLIVR